jgi:hypothetical protein
LGRTAGPVWQIGKSLGRTAEHVSQYFELQNNGSVLPSILLTCLSRLSGRIELEDPKTHQKVASKQWQCAAQHHPNPFVKTFWTY